MTEEQVRQWLLDYAWLYAPDDPRRALEVECIMAQDGWKHLSAQTEHYASMAESPGPEAYADAHGFALSALYECHDGPHLARCPHWKGGDPDAVIPPQHRTTEG